jgi:hypothetical protein
MDIRRLQQILDAYGVDARLWPQAERDIAEALIATSDAARAAYDAALRDDGILDQIPRVVPPSALAADIISAAAPSPIRRLASALWPFGPAWQPATALAAAMLLGLVVGPVLPGATTADDEAVTVNAVDLLYAAPLDDETLP